MKWTQLFVKWTLRRSCHHQPLHIQHAYMQKNTHMLVDSEVKGRDVLNPTHQCVLRPDWFAPGAGVQHLTTTTTHFCSTLAGLTFRSIKCYIPFTCFLLLNLKYSKDNQNIQVWSYSSVCGLRVLKIYIFFFYRNFPNLMRNTNTTVFNVKS